MEVPRSNRGARSLTENAVSAKKTTGRSVRPCPTGSGQRGGYRDQSRFHPDIPFWRARSWVVGRTLSSRDAVFERRQRVGDEPRDRPAIKATLPTLETFVMERLAAAGDDELLADLAEEVAAWDGCDEIVPVSVN